MHICIIKRYLIVSFLMLFTMSAVANPMVIAHRGNSSEAPENTLAAVQSAIALDPQPQYIEIDLHQSQDGVLVVAHDENTLRTTGKSMMIRQTPFEQLRTLSAGYAERFGDAFAGEQLPTLNEVLERVEDTPIGIMIECKQLLLEEPVIRLLRERGEVEKHVLASFDELTVYRSKEMEPQLRTLYLTTLSDGSRMRGHDVRADIIGTNQSASLDQIQQAREEGFSVWVWTVDDPEKMDQLIRVPADGIISNKPRLVWERIHSNR